MRIVTLLLLLSICCGCSSSVRTPQQTYSQSATYHALQIQLEPQLGSTSCWAATLNMHPNVSKRLPNVEGTPPRRFLDIQRELGTAPTEHLNSVFNLSFGQIKTNLRQEPLIYYRYFNSTEAHVALIRGYSESKFNQWLLINDPWPINQGTLRAVNMRHFMKPIFSNFLKTFPYIQSQNEHAFSLIGSNAVSADSNDYNSPYITSKFNHVSANGIQDEIKERSEVIKLAENWLANASNEHPEFLEFIGLDSQKLEQAKVDKASLTKHVNTYEDFLNQPKPPESNFLRVISNDSQSSQNSLFENVRAYFVDIVQDGEKRTTLTIEPDLRTKEGNEIQLYIGKIEPYQYSQHKTVQEASLLIGDGIRSVPLQNMQIQETQTGYLVGFEVEKIGERLVLDPFDQLIPENGTLPLFEKAGLKIYKSTDIKLKEVLKATN